MKKKTTIAIEAVRDFATEQPELLIIAADPTNDTLFVTYRGEAMVGSFGGDVVERVLTVERFNSAHKQFTNTVLPATARVINAVLDGIQGINESLSANNEEHGKTGKSSARGGRSAKGGSTRKRTRPNRADSKV